MHHYRASSATGLILGGTTVGMILLHPLGMALGTEGRLVFETLVRSIPLAFHGPMAPMAAVYGLLGASTAVAIRGLTGGAAQAGPRPMPPAPRQVDWGCIVCGRTVLSPGGHPAGWLLVDPAPGNGGDDRTRPGLCPRCHVDTVDRMLRALGGPQPVIGPGAQANGADSPAAVAPRGTK